MERQREYKVAALRAKKQGDLEQARLYLKISKVGSGCNENDFINLLLLLICGGEALLSSGVNV